MTRKDPLRHDFAYRPGIYPWFVRRRKCAVSCATVIAGRIG
jgi:hypothetical protein